MSRVIGVAIKRENGSATCRRIDEQGNTRTLSTKKAATYFDKHPTYKAIQPEENDGQHMVSIPAFYVKSGLLEDGSRAYWLSPKKREGFHLHPAFYHQGKPLCAFLVGAYEGSLDAQHRICSLPDQKTAGNRNFHDMQAACRARNIAVTQGWQMLTVYQLAALQRLALIEAGSTDSQAAFGPGNVGHKGRLQTGQSGHAWRGIHDLWGNSWCMVAGLETDENHQIFLLDDKGHGQLLATGITTPCNESGYIVDMHDEFAPGFDLGDIFLPKATTEEQSESTYPDRFWKSWNGERNVLYHGGHWGYGSGAGLFCLNLTHTASYASTSVGCRLAKA